MGLPAGKLDRRVTIYRPADSTDDGYTTKPGGPPVVYARRWAWAQPAKGAERVEALGREGKRLMSFWLRWDALTRAIKETYTIELDGLTYEITGVNPVGRREGVEVLGIAGD